MTMGDLKKVMSSLDTIMTESESLLDKMQGNVATVVKQLQTRSDKLNEQNVAFRSELVGVSRRIFQYEEYYNIVHPMWGALDAARKLLAMGKPAQALKMLERAQSVWEKEVFTFDLDDFPQTVKSSFNGLVGKVDGLFDDAFAAIDAGDKNADTPLRNLMVKTDNLFDVCDDALDELLDDLKAN